MPQLAHSDPPRQVAPFSISEIRLDVEVLADRYEVLSALSHFEDRPIEEADADAETADLPF